MSILDERELTDEERAAIADEPRPGVWIEEHEVFHKIRERPISTRTGRPVEVTPEIQRLGDGRTLSQHDTDTMIVAELHTLGDVNISSIVGPRTVVNLPNSQYGAWAQRGGIHSDPLVRLLAIRAWGDRDRRWRKRDTALFVARNLLHDEVIDAYRRAYGFDGVAMYDQGWRHMIVYTAGRNGREATVEVPTSAGRSKHPHDVVLDAFDELDAKLAAGGDEPSASSGISFDLADR